MGGAGGSIILVEEFYASQDERFLSALCAVRDSKRLAPFADRWKKDTRPWAREQIFAYLRVPILPQDHEPVVKRLFKHFEGLRDHAMMAAFMVAFDRIVRRRRVKQHRYDWQTRRSWEEERLVTPRRTRWSKTGGIFTYRTRYYLRRRAWRYFRRMGFQWPAAYVPEVSLALRAYRDDDFARGENILDSWGIVHALFRESEALKFGVSKINLKDGHGLDELTPAPQFPKLWFDSAATPILLDLVATGASRLVRSWAMMLLRREHLDRLAGIAAESLLKLLDHDDGEVQQFGAELLEKAGNLDKLPLATWFTLLRTRNLTALEAVVRILEQHVAPERFTVEQCVDLATGEAVSVARLGLRLLKAKLPIRKSDHEAVSRLATARAAAAGREIGILGLSILGVAGAYDVELVIRFFDSLLADMRQAAWEWLTPESPGYNDPALWAKLLETPFDDTRLQLVATLEKRSKLPGVGAEGLAVLWNAVLLAIHRGGRQKLTALRQISAALRGDPSRAEVLLPVIAAAIRSVRLPEARAGLSAVVAAVDARPEIAPLLARYLPELQMQEVGG